MTEPNAPRGSAPLDELAAVQRLLAERPPPSEGVVAAARASLRQAGVVPAAGLAPVHLNSGRSRPGPDDGGTRRRWRRWQAWLAPVAAAAAVATAVAVSLAISGTVGRPHARPSRPASAALPAGIPRYFVALTGGSNPAGGKYAVIAATATGAIVAKVAPPKPYGVFTEVAAAGDDRTFVLAAQRNVGPGPVSETSPLKLYRLVLRPSGKPAALTALPVPPVIGNVSGFALSPDGSKLAVAASPPLRLRSGHPPLPHGSRLRLFTLATGAERVWTLPGIGWIGMNKPNPQSLSWAGDNRTLLVHVQLGVGGPKAEVRLLDTAKPGGFLPPASKLVPFPEGRNGGPLFGVMLLSADGTKIITATSRNTFHGGLTNAERAALRLPRQCRQRGREAKLKIRYSANQKTRYCQRMLRTMQQRMSQDSRKNPLTIMTYASYGEYSARTGKPVAVLGHLQGQGDTGADVYWAGPAGTAMIVDGPAPDSTLRHPASEFGVLAGKAVTPLPPAVQFLIDSATTATLAW